MQRQLILMRHAKSSWKVAGLSDHDRPLNPRGQREAPVVAQLLAAMGWSPRQVHSSDAQRTRETWAAMAPLLDGTVAEFHSELYLGDLTSIRHVARAWPDSERGPVLVLGPNPGWEAAATILSGTPLSFTTANAALVEGTGATWEAALRRPWRLVEFLRPRERSKPSAPTD